MTGHNALDPVPDHAKPMWQQQNRMRDHADVNEPYHATCSAQTRRHIGLPAYRVRIAYRQGNLVPSVFHARLHPVRSSRQAVQPRNSPNLPRRRVIRPLPHGHSIPGTTRGPGSTGSGRRPVPGETGATSLRNHPIPAILAPGLPSAKRPRTCLGQFAGPIRKPPIGSIHGAAGLGPKPVHHETPVTAPDSSVS